MQRNAVSGEEDRSEAGMAPAAGQDLRAEKPGLVRTAVLVAGSALFGGLAVALWHRRTLAKMRQDPVALPQRPPDLPEEGSTLD